MAGKRHTVVWTTVSSDLAVDERVRLYELLDRCRVVAEEIADGGLDYSALGDFQIQELEDLVNRLEV